MKKTIALLVLITMLLTANLVYSFNLKNPSIFTSNELISPANRIDKDQVHFYNDRIVIDINQATWATYANTNSMDPVLDQGAIGIEIIPLSEAEIQIGDIITYQPDWTDGLTVHRVITTGEDEEGWYCYTKGDNTSFVDPGKIRFDQIRYITIGVLY